MVRASRMNRTKLSEPEGTADTIPMAIPVDYTLKEIKSKMIKESLNFIIIKELPKRSGLSGYDIIDLIYKKFGESISPGTVYSTLYAIERRGLIFGESDGRKTIYKLTEKGKTVVESLKDFQEELTDVCAKIYCNKK